MQSEDDEPPPPQTVARARKEPLMKIGDILLGWVLARGRPNWQDFDIGIVISHNVIDNEFVVTVRSSVAPTIDWILTRAFSACATVEASR